MENFLQESIESILEDSSAFLEESDKINVGISGSIYALFTVGILR